MFIFHQQAEVKTIVLLKSLNKNLRVFHYSICLINSLIINLFSVLPQMLVYDPEFFISVHPTRKSNSTV